MHVILGILLLRQKLIVVLVAIGREVREVGLIVLVGQEGCHAFILVQHVA